MYRLRKAERLCSKKLLTHIFAQKQSLLAYPLKVMYANPPSGVCLPHPVQMTVSVPKRLFKKAHERNRIKRQIRNCYRLQKQALWDALQSQQTQMTLIFVYLSPEAFSYSELSKRMATLLEKLANTP